MGGEWFDTTESLTTTVPTREAVELLFSILRMLKRPQRQLKDVIAHNRRKGWVDGS
jgi:hypothetical protein